MTFVQPLDLETIFVDNFAGTAEIFAFLVFALIGILAAKFRMPNVIVGIMFGLLGILLASSPVFSGLYVLVLTIGGIVIFWALGGIWKR